MTPVALEKPPTDLIAKLFYEKVEHLEACEFYTDEWRSFAKVLPQARYKISRSGRASIERDNSNTRHHLGRFTRRYCSYLRIIIFRVAEKSAAVNV